MSHRITSLAEGRCYAAHMTYLQNGGAPGALRAVTRAARGWGPPLRRTSPGGGSRGRALRPRALGLAERLRFPLAGAPADRDDTRRRRDLLRRGEDRLGGGEARRAQAPPLDPPRHPPVRVADLRPQVNF